MLELMLKEYPGYNMLYLRKLYKEHMLADSESESDDEFEQFMDILNGLDCLRGINYIRIIKQINKLLETKEKNKTDEREVCSANFSLKAYGTILC